MKIYRHIKFLYKNKLIKLRLTFHEILSNILITGLSITAISYKEILIDKICSFFAYGPDIVANGLSICALILCCVYLSVKVSVLFARKELVFYKSLGFNNIDIAGLKCCNIFIDALLCSAFITVFGVKSPATVKATDFPIYCLLLFIFFITVPITLSYLYNPLKGKKQLINKNSAVVNNIFFRNKYTAYLYKDICRLKSNADFLIGVTLNTAIMTFITLNGKDINIYLFMFSCYFITFIISATSVDFYLIEKKDCKLYYASGMNVKKLLRHKIFNVSVISYFFVFVYYLTNTALGNISFASTYMMFICIVMYSFIMILCSNLAVVRYFPNEESMKSHSLTIALSSIIPVLTIIFTVYLLKNVFETSRLNKQRNHKKQSDGDVK